MTKLCECGCGEIVAKGKRFVHLHHLKGKTNPRYRGGLYLSTEKNRWIIICRDGSREYYARAVMECQLKRELLPEESVHHIDGNTVNDVPENLVVMDRLEHNLLSATKYTEEDLLDYLRQFFKEHGRSPCSYEFLSLEGYPHRSSYLRVFGKWNVALRLAGLPINRKATRSKEAVNQ